MEAIAIKITLSGVDHIIVSIYQSPNLPLIPEDLNVLLSLGSHVLLAGDFNANHDHWISGINNAHGPRTPTKSPHPPDTKTFQRLQPCTSVAAMELWSQCYERWLTPLDAPAVGIVQYHVFNYAVRKEIRRLEEKLKSFSIMSNRHSNGDTDPTEANPPSVVSRFYPFSHDHSNLNSRALDSMQVSLIDASQLLDSQSLLNAPD
ncbi:hypothetical protein JYU34_016123 [Plutella xylostella]|uniref:Endonuclease/exonuclease/phosphatase domain-containing protein n=1 Tax=Plutella xylostella TaxID=51655 RepID=A0ABQ7Q5H3_PLUXY|nr:hypothetical protein JYU34_016123 [Plutella xylostella]